MQRILLVTLFCFIVLVSTSQVINAYAEISGIGGSVITLTNLDESFDTFEDGEQIIIMQMQDDVIGGNTADNASFGDIATIASAGLYEIRTISSHVEAAGAPINLTVSSPLSNTYNLSSNSKVQVISFPTFGSPDYTTTGNISAKNWNGNIGGVIAFQVNGVLTLANNIDADADGFIGATANGGGSGSCNGASNFRANPGNNFGNKGQGIYNVTNNLYRAGRGKIINGGGGGNSHNAGGGGGSNFSTGGNGGPGWPNCTPSAGGMGGYDLSPFISASRAFMGGSGGAGEGNNGGSQNGGNGGGIVLIKASEIRTNGSCGGLSISANGQSITNGSGNDGNSGGGAGGSIIFEVDSWNIASSCPLTIETNGGNGGNVTSSAMHGGGGGGGMGPIIFSNSQPTSNTTLNTAPGNGGNNCFSCPSAGSGGGSNGNGIISGSSGPLPINLIHFDAEPINNTYVQINWKTASEINNDYFTVERSQHGNNWNVIDQVEGAGNSSYPIDYSTIDNNPHSGISYYRLRQTDFNGIYTYSKIVPVEIINTVISAYPNPTNNIITLTGLDSSIEYFNLFNSLGQNIFNQVLVIEKNQSKLVLDLSNLSNGIYTFQSSTLNIQIYKQ